MVRDITQMSGGLPADRGEEVHRSAVSAVITFSDVGGTRAQLRLWPVTEKRTGEEPVGPDVRTFGPAPGQIPAAILIS